MRKILMLCLGVMSIFQVICAHDDLKAPSEQLTAEKMEVVEFTPPAGWRYGEQRPEHKHVRSMVIGKGEHELPPSLTLATDRFQGPLKEYLKRAKGISEADGGVWKNLGSIRTEAGEATLIQEDRKTNWGDLRLMYVFLPRNGTVYILTAAALKEEFVKFYADFFRSMRSLRIRTEDTKDEIGKLQETVK